MNEITEIVGQLQALLPPLNAVERTVSRKGLNKAAATINSTVKTLTEIIMALTKEGQDMQAATARITADEALIVALQAQVKTLQSGSAESPEDTAAQTGLETVLATTQPTDTTGALTPTAPPNPGS